MKGVNALNQAGFYHWIETSEKFKKFVSALLIVSISTFSLESTVIAASQNFPAYQKTTTTSAKAPKSTPERFASKVQEVNDTVDKFLLNLNQKQNINSEKSSLKTLRSELSGMNIEVMDEFSALADHIKSRKLSNEILKRHEDAVAKYKSEFSLLMTSLQNIDQASNTDDHKTRVKNLKDHLQKIKLKRSHVHDDPDNLSNRALEPDPANKPKLKPQDFTQAKLFNNPLPMYAAVGDFTFENLSGANDPRYLEANDEVKLSPYIIAKANEFNNDPVKIYHWVRNNIDWIPTWGASQDAEITLGSQRGNALDISSLLIALLRASGFPARYVHGSIDVDAEKFKNWAGGFESIYGAADFAGTGGIPVTTVISGGQVAKVRLEHVWVEAAIDYHPSRGAKNVDADKWLAMDASFKQYEFIDGINVNDIAGTNLENILTNYYASGTVNGATGAVTGFDASIIENMLITQETAVKQHIEGLTTPTTEVVFGGKRTIKKEYPVLGSSLPNHVFVEGARYAKLPDALQNKITFSIGKDIFGEPLNPVTFSWARVNNRKVSLAFSPATPADSVALESFYPSPETVTSFDQWPSRIPSYLIQVVPQLIVEGQVVATGSALALGEEIDFAYEVTLRGIGSHPYSYPVIAGSFLNIPVISSSISTDLLEQLTTKLENTIAKMDSTDDAILSTITREDTMGDFYYAGSLNYFSQYIAYSESMGRKQIPKAYFNLGIGYGSFGYEPKVDYFFGFPRAIETGGTFYNIRVFNRFGSSNGNQDRLRDYKFQTGVLSSTLEHSAQEFIYYENRPDVEGISAIKALTIARANGQAIYQITPENQASVLTKIHFDTDSMAEIRAALAGGRYVITHTDPISVPGWSGAGYILFDPVTVAGAFKISGGQNGGYVDTPDPVLQKLAAQSTAYYDLYKLFKDLAGEWKNNPAKAGLGALNKLLKTIIKTTVKLGVEHSSDYCLTPTQGASLETALDGLGAMSWVSNAANGVPGVGAQVFLGQLLGYMVIFYYMMNFIKINRAIDDCRVQSARNYHRPPEFEFSAIQGGVA